MGIKGLIFLEARACFSVHSGIPIVSRRDKALRMMNFELCLTSRAAQ